MYVHYLDPTSAFDNGYKSEYHLTPANNQPFQSGLAKFVRLVNSFSLEMSFIHDLDSNVPTSSSCFTWAITQNFEYSLEGPVVVSLNFLRGICGNDESNKINRLPIQKVLTT